MEAPSVGGAFLAAVLPQLAAQNHAAWRLLMRACLLSCLSLAFFFFCLGLRLGVALPAPLCAIDRVLHRSACNLYRALPPGVLRYAKIKPMRLLIVAVPGREWVHPKFFPFFVLSLPFLSPCLSFLARSRLVSFTPLSPVPHCNAV